MKKTKLIWFTILLLPIIAPAQVVQNFDTIFSFYFTVLEHYVDNPNCDSSLIRLEAINFLTITTGKGVRSDGNFFGHSIIKRNELEFYENWYKSSRNEINIISLRKKLADRGFHSRYMFIEKLILD